MMRFLYKKRRLLLSGFLVAELLFSSALPASAGLFGGGMSIPSASSVFSDMEKRYHLDTGSLRGQGESFNVAGNKQPTPEVSLFFNPSDPKEGEKLTAKAFPMYFSNPENALYYTWYLKHVGCDLGSKKLALCDHDGNGKITVEDWKIEASSILVQNGFDKNEANFGSDTDNDGYKARYGGDNKEGSPDHCFVNDPASGNNYELGSNTVNIDFSCPKGTDPICLLGEGRINPVDISIPGSSGSDPFSPISGVPGTSGPAFGFSDTGVCHSAGLPMCSGGVPSCSVGTPRCLANPTISTSCGSALNSCGGGGNIAPFCKHLFPNAPAQISGDGSFGASEERFWGTNPADPDTADNGNKDEANITGLGQSSFTWNYVSGDQVGVAIEGTSMVSTKYSDSSAMIMWAFPKKNCPVKNTGSFARSIKGYSVTMLSADMNLNDCLAGNLIDPAQGGQATNLDVTLANTTDNPNNDESGDGSGDQITLQATVANAARGLNEVLFEWKVELSNNVQFRNGPGLVSADVTADLQKYGLLGNIKGIALDTARLKLDMKNKDDKLLAGRLFHNYLTNESGYLRFSVKAVEGFTSGATRKGKSDIIVKFASASKKISAYKAGTRLVGSGMQVTLPNPLANLICEDDALDRASCRVIKNEVIALRVNPANLNNFQWMVNGAPLTCTRAAVSPDCIDGSENEVNFLPVAGNVGDTYTVTVTANDTTGKKNDPNSDKTITLTRSFNIVEPKLSIKSSDLTVAWPKFLGQYKDVEAINTAACVNGLCSDYSESILRAFAGENLSFKGSFMPNFLAAQSERQWTVDGLETSEVAGKITFKALKDPLGVYNITLVASMVQSQDIRRAMRDIWHISPLDSPEIHFSTTAQIELEEAGFTQGPLKGSQKYLAAIASYVPASVMFSLRIFLSVALLLFTASFLYALIPEHNGSPAVQRRHDE